MASLTTNCIISSQSPYPYFIMVWMMFSRVQIVRTTQYLISAKTCSVQKETGLADPHYNYWSKVIECTYCEIMPNICIYAKVWDIFISFTSRKMFSVVQPLKPSSPPRIYSLEIFFFNHFQKHYTCEKKNLMDYIHFCLKQFIVDIILAITIQMFGLLRCSRSNPNQLYCVWYKRGLFCEIPCSSLQYKSL